MTDLDRNAILKEIGITQWVLRDEDGRDLSVQEAPIKQGKQVPEDVSALASEHTPGKDQPEEGAAISAKLTDQTTSVEPPQIAAITLESLRAEVAGCTACKLSESRMQTVFGEGPNQADWLLVGEAPGQQEDRQGKPFVGRAGGLLTQMIRALDKSREQVFITNTLKCRPPNNRDPLPDELKACEAYLLKQIELIQPKVMVALGRISAQALLKSDQPLGKLRGQVYQYGPNKIPLIVTYHPAYLLRQPGDKGKVWEDLLLAHRQLPV